MTKSSTPPIIRVKPTDAHDKFFREVHEAIQESARKHKDITSLEILAILGRTLGYFVCAYPEDRREGIMEIIQQNINSAIEDVQNGNVTIEAKVAEDSTGKPN